MRPAFLRSPFAILLAVVLGFAAWAGWGWLQQGPSSEELFLPLAKTLDFEQGCRSVHGIAWWTPNYLAGHSLAPVWATAFDSLFLELGRICFGPIAGYKIVGLLALVLSGLGMYAFVAELTGCALTAAWAGAFYVLCPEFSIRLAQVEHLSTAMAFVFPPLLFHRLLRLRQEEGMKKWLLNGLLLALILSAMILTTTKVASLFLPALAFYALWLYFSRPEGRDRFLLACGWGALATFFLAVLPILPLMREQGWMTLFAHDPMAEWQDTFTLKTALSWFDRGGWILGHAPPPLHVSGAAFYFGLVWIAVLGLALREPGPLRGWLQTREGGFCRFFLALALFFGWVSYGPAPIWSAHMQILHYGADLPNWSVTLLWLALAFQVAVVVRLARSWSRRGLVLLCVAAAYLFLPLFQIFERVPLYSQLRAPDSAWSVSGSFCLAIAGALALRAVVRSLLPARLPARFHPLAGWAAVAFLFFDFAGYHASFWTGELPQDVYPQFLQSADFIRKSEDPGSVMAVSGRYFYLQLPQLTGRPLNNEAATSYYQMKWTRDLNDAAAKMQTPEGFVQSLRAAGVGFILIDRTDPSTAGNFQNLLRSLFPVAFETADFTVLRCSPPGAPALATGRVRFVPSADPGPALQGLAQDVWTVAPGLDGSAFSAPAGTSGAKSSPLPLLQPREADYQTIRVAPTPPGQPWVIVPESYHPDWTAEADGQPLPVYRALGCYLAAHAPHDGAAVTFRFRQPWWYNAVIVVAGLGWVLALGAWIVLRRKERPTALP